MARYLLLAINSPTTGVGDEDEYNSWYNEVHLPDLRRVTGNISTRRFKVVWQSRIDKKFMALTEFETDDPEALLSELADRASDFTDKIDRTTSIALLGVELDIASG